ncbi:hypothetical protein GF367_00430 [Candidatus Woesearchaeota archaeon]|nr:hypothetical protein [Candidatus Woesearchaeota archaeon]
MVMPYSPDPLDWSANDWADREFVKYRLTEHERKSLAAIRENLEKQAYEDPARCQEHLRLVGRLANDLKMVIANERSIGKANWALEKTYHDVKELYQELSDTYAEFQ